MAQQPRRYKALAHIYVGGRLLFPEGTIFETSEAFGNALIANSQAVAYFEMNGRVAHKRRDVRPEGSE